MPGRVEEHPEGRTGLVIVLDRTDTEHGRFSRVEVIDDHVEMHLLRNLLARPAGRCVSLHLLEGDALAVLRADLRPVGRHSDLPIQQPAVERREGARVGTIDDEAWKARYSHTGTLCTTTDIFRGGLVDDPDCCHPWCMQTVYEAAGGDEGLLRLASAWHARVMADEVVSHAFIHGFHPEHTERLAAYWAEALGGPTTYSDSYGDETSVVRIHSGNGPHEEMDRRAIICFGQAMTDIAISKNDLVRPVLHDYFAWATTTTMSRYYRSEDDVPDGLRMPHWSWDGLQH